MHVIDPGLDFRFKLHNPANPTFPTTQLRSRDQVKIHLSTPLLVMPLLEIACFNIESGLIAQAAGADRIELCKNQQLGGTTPLLSDFQELKKHVEIPINVMIRPRGGDFTYDVNEIQQMGVELESFRDHGADGFVFGILGAGKVDIEKCRDLIEKAQGLPCTFHRAFDEIAEKDMLEQLNVLMECGFTSVLSSGGQKNAQEGIEVLKRLVETSKRRIDVIVGGGVRSTNLQEIERATGSGTFHSSAIVDGGEVTSKEEVEALKGIVRR
ncbi:copper homeostasis protein CutC [Mollisia scopiformis]|uniref:Copper homeostasis protein cutC homolog n=1 Tax=Mollisia scopiformis TaxID=149040 RepID=A0A132B3Z6_MOLSC|nr:copper homeostasis protein CutC [Mollisia scopiformis]KUJ06644.1 copper homeostasis protein CutC [Mollisia scopiformis]